MSQLEDTLKLFHGEDLIEAAATVPVTSIEAAVWIRRQVMQVRRLLADAIQAEAAEATLRDLVIRFHGNQWISNAQLAKKKQELVQLLHEVQCLDYKKPRFLEIAKAYQLADENQQLTLASMVQSLESVLKVNQSWNSSYKDPYEGETNFDMNTSMRNRAVYMMESHVNSNPYESEVSSLRNGIFRLITRDLESLIKCL